MSLFYDKKKAISAILGPDSPGVGSKEEMAEDENSSALKVAAHELCQAVADKNVEGVVSAFRAMFAACEHEPHEEYGG